jgi:phosphodiesterase/alkaline phosphatase D-like protein
MMPAALAAQSADAPRVTHGPFLGHVSETEVWVWGRTARSGPLRVRYGVSPGNLDQVSATVATQLDHDNAAWIKLTGLTPGTRYHYRLDGGGEVGTFQTVPSADQVRDAETNPRGLFNFRFAFGSCAQQRIDPSLPAYKLLRERHAPQLLFGVMNGDWLYEEKREFPADQWRQQVGIAEAQTPRIVRLAPSITGVWENYKLYLERGKNLAAWHRDVPGYFTPDDHEILNDVYGTGTAGTRTREAVFRDISLHAWYDYIAGSNPLATSQGLLFGEGEIDGNVLTTDDIDFSKVDWSQASNLHVHWGGQLAGVPPGQNRAPGDPNAGVYDVDEVLGARRMRIRPAGRQRGRCVFSIGRQNYSKFRVGNVEVYLLDTRGSRDMHDVNNPGKQGVSMIGRRQREWLKSSMASSTADFFFLASTVNLMIPHMGSPGSVGPLDGKDDAWTAFVPEREELIQFWDSLGKPVMVMTGDLHNSFSVKVTDRVWEFAAGPHNSQNHPHTSEGNRPANGPFDSRGRRCEVRWSSYIRLDVPPELRRWRIYAIAQINNVFPNPKEKGKMRWVAYPKPHVVIQYYDGQTGELLYAEPVHSA